MPRIKHRSSRRVPPPKDSDFDHEIGLVDHSGPDLGDDDNSSNSNKNSNKNTNRNNASRPSSASQSSPTPSPSASGPRKSRSRNSSSKLPSSDSDIAPNETPVANHNGHPPGTAGPSVHVEQPTPQPDMVPSRTRSARSRPKSKSPETAIDILYENQRGGFLCGMPLFSSKALGNLDPPAWTNYAHKPSPTDINTAQVPDPSWEWAWPEWRVNHDTDVDEDGWEYSFAFSSKFSWHKASWWNSFVRRRAWIRKRAKKDAGYLMQNPDMLNPEYFSVRPSLELGHERSPSRATVSSHRAGRRSVMSEASQDADEEQADIEDVDTLMRILRKSRIDREKIEAVENFLEHGEQELEGLEHVMHEIMSIFVFQASRRALLTKLTEIHDRTVELQKEAHKMDQDTAKRQGRRADNLAAAVKHAEEEVRRLEYWSDVKGMAEEGDSKGAVDTSQGWDPSWKGLDKSGPSEPTPPPRDMDGTA